MPDKLFRCLSCYGFDYLELVQADFHVFFWQSSLFFKFAYFNAQEDILDLSSTFPASALIPGISIKSWFFRRVVIR